MDQQVVRSILSRGMSQRSTRKQLSFHDLPIDHASEDGGDMDGIKISHARPISDMVRRGPMPVTGRGQFVARHRLRDDDASLLPRSLWAQQHTAGGVKEEVFRAVNIPDEYKEAIPAAEWEAASKRCSCTAIWADYFSCCSRSHHGTYEPSAEDGAYDPLRGVTYAATSGDLESRLIAEARRHDAESFVYQPF